MLNINISPNITQAMFQGRLTTKQIEEVAAAHYVGSFMPDAELVIQFDRDRGLEVFRSKKPCQGSIYVKDITGIKRFTSRFGNATDQVGLNKFLTDYSNFYYDGSM